MNDSSTEKSEQNLEYEQDGVEEEEEEVHEKQISVQFVSETGEAPFPPFEVPRDITPAKLLLIIRAFLTEDEEKNRPYLFFVNNAEITEDLASVLKYQLIDYESTLSIVYQPQAVFRVRGVTRCTSSLSGHGEPVVAALFSPTGRHLASGSGDKTVRLWDLTTETPQHVCKGHLGWVLALAWAPDGALLASGDKTGQVILWDPETGKARGRPLTGHKQWITSLAWEPLHLGDGTSRKLASASKDGAVRVWDSARGSCLRVMTSHTASVTCLKWGGASLLYSASQDRTIKVWRASDGALCRTLQGHGHWVNVLALNTDYVMRTGAFDPKDAKVVADDSLLPAEEAKANAETRYNAVMKVTTDQLDLFSNKSLKQVVGEEMLVSGSDDFTLFLWKPGSEKTPVARMTGLRLQEYVDNMLQPYFHAGHQQLVNDVKFSPDARLVASASFDKSIRVGRTKRLPFHKSST